MKTKKKILLLGGNGYLGNEILEKFHDNKIYIFDKKLKKKNINPNHVFIKGDLNRKMDYSKLPKNIDIVIFLAGSKGGPDSLDLDKVNKYLNNNFLILRAFLNYSSRVNYKKIIFASTEHVYQSEFNKITKNELLPINFYGLSKLICEKYLYNFFKEKKICILIIRFPRVIGLKKNNLIHNLIKRFSKKQIKIDNNNQNFNFIFIDDLTNAIDRCISFKGSYEIFDIFNNDNPISLINIIKKISKKIDRKIKIEKMPITNNIKHNPKNLFISNNYTKKKLNWKPKYSLDRILTCLIKFEK